MRAFISIVKKLELRAQELSPAPTSHNYAPTVISRQPEAKDQGIRKAELVDSMNRLLDQRRVRVVTLRADSSRERKSLRLGNEGQ
jgi:hypothetical protein